MNVLLALTLALPLLAPPDAALTNQEREKALTALRESERALLETLAPLSDVQWSYKPAADRWSVGEVVEHLMLTETSTLRLIEDSLNQRPDPNWRARPAALTEDLTKRVLDRSQKSKAPEGISPRGVLSRQEILRKYREARAWRSAIVQRAGLPLKAHFASGPPGTYNLYEWMLLISLHNQRHNAQIAEVIADPGFPK